MAYISIVYAIGALIHSARHSMKTKSTNYRNMMSTEDLLMEIQDTDELLYTQAEAELMLEYKESVQDFNPHNDDEKATREELIGKFDKLNALISEFNDRIELTANNPANPSKEEIAALKRLFTQIEDLDFETSDKYKFLTGDLS